MVGCCGAGGGWGGVGGAGWVEGQFLVGGTGCGWVGGGGRLGGLGLTLTPLSGKAPRARELSFTQGRKMNWTCLQTVVLEPQLATNTGSGQQETLWELGTRHVLYCEAGCTARGLLHWDFSTGRRNASRLSIRPLCFCRRSPKTPCSSGLLGPPSCSSLKQRVHIPSSEVGLRSNSRNFPPGGLGSSSISDGASVCGRVQRGVPKQGR